MSSYVFDIETDGLLDVCEECWIIVLLDIDTGELLTFLPHLGEMGWVDVFDSAELLIGHNVKGFDFPALEKIFGYSLPRSVAVHDTMIMSQVMDYSRFGTAGHSMAVWGEFFGQPKVEHEEWDRYSEEMRVRCTSDVLLNKRIYDVVFEEFITLADRNPNIRPYMRAEHAVAEWCAKAELYGWPFDVPRANALFGEMNDALEDCRRQVQPLLGLKADPYDRVAGGVFDNLGRFTGEAHAKAPKWTRAGTYDAHTARWFNIDPYSGLLDDGDTDLRPIVGPYCRVEFRALALDSIADVKVFLFRNDWQPTEWNYKKVLNTGTGKYEFERKSPKITEDSLQAMQGHGKLYCDFLTTKSRHAILKSWLENVDVNGNLHGGSFPIGTPSMRCRHSGIVNVPSADSAWGPQMRALFTCLPGWRLIGCDSSGNQARGLAHYLQNQDFVNLLLHGDIHQYNADVATKVLQVMGITHTVPRSVAKRILYAFLFGASGSKLWSYIFGVQDKSKGARFKDGFLRAVPGFKQLLDKLKKIYKATSARGPGYIPSIAGNRVYVDSEHKLLVYLLQSCEKATCGMALALTMERLEERGIPYRPCIFMHDEIDYQTPELYGEEATQIGTQAFTDGPQRFGISIMAGEGKIGNTWYDVH